MPKPMSDGEYMMYMVPIKLKEPADTTDIIAFLMETVSGYQTAVNAMLAGDARGMEVLVHTYNQTAETVVELAKVSLGGQSADDIRETDRINMADVKPHRWEASDYSVSDLCAAMVMRTGGGDMCGLPRSHPVHDG